MKINLKIILILLLVEKTFPFKQTRECDFKSTVDRCLKSLKVFDVNTGEITFKKFPTTFDQLSKVCDELKRSEVCAQDFIDRCTETGIESRVLNHALESGVRVLKRVCRTKSRKDEFLNNVVCANSVVQQGLTCLGDYKRLLYATNKLNNKQLILRALCCKARQIIPCILNAMNQKPKDVCSSSNIAYLKSLQEAIKVEVTEVACADFENDSCTDVKVPAVKQKDYATKSVFIPLKQLLDKVLV